MKVKLILAFALLACMAGTLSAQTLFDKPLRTAGIGLGWYKPSLDYINDRLTDPENDQNQIIDTATGETISIPYDETLDGTFMAQAFVELNLFSPVYLRLSGGQWTQSVTNDGISAQYNNYAFERTRVTLMPVTADLIFSVPAFTDLVSGTEAYIGVGAGMCYVDESRTRYTRGYYFEIPGSSASGQDFIYHVLLGVEQPLIKSNFVYKLEYDAMFGKYDKNGTPLLNNTLSKEELSMGGYRFNLLLGYKF